ncbi:NPCBM/NEW2 domain-containing protein [Streptomyces sp. NPDC085639]|uniref:NPCBM/NEW2 domain-containing protein n=1 Tax=Streptomyces sp. NPDC085639 TaxID=3365734 RepID=UPI0037D359BA
MLADDLGYGDLGAYGRSNGKQAAAPRSPSATATLTGATGPTAIDLDVTGVRLLHLLVEDANARSSFDHTAWARPCVTVR